MAQTMSLRDCRKMCERNKANKAMTALLGYGKSTVSILHCYLNPEAGSPLESVEHSRNKGLQTPFEVTDGTKVDSSRQTPLYNLTHRLKEQSS